MGAEGGVGGATQHEGQAPLGDVEGLGELRALGLLGRERLQVHAEGEHRGRVVSRRQSVERTHGLRRRARELEGFAREHPAGIARGSWVRCPVEACAVRGELHMGEGQAGAFRCREGHGGRVSARGRQRQSIARPRREIDGGPPPRGLGAPLCSSRLLIDKGDGQGTGLIGERRRPGLPRSSSVRISQRGEKGQSLATRAIVVRAANGLQEEPGRLRVLLGVLVGPPAARDEHRGPEDVHQSALSAGRGLARQRLVARHRSFPL